MSIILKALKKLQDEKVRETGGPPVDEAEQEDSAPTEDAFPSSLASGEDEPGLDTTRGYVKDIAARSRRESPVLSAAAQRFGVGPKTLLAIVLVLGVFTTGWFASRIYLNMMLATRSEKSGAPTDTTATVADKAAVSEAVQENEAVPAAVTAADSKPEAAPSAAASASPPVVEVAAAEPTPEPPARVAEPPSPTIDSSVAAPVPRQPKEQKPKREGRPELKINAIAWKNKEPRAIVNMQSVYEGDVIEGATVLAIQRKVILFEYEGETFEVRF